MKHRSVLIAAIILVMLLQTGCWDMIEIENRAMVGAIMIDIIENSQDAQDKGEGSPFCEDQPNIIKVTFGVNSAPKLVKGEKDAGMPVEIEAANIPDAMEILGSKIPRVPFYGQIRLLIFSKRLTENDSVFRQVIDEFERKAIINRNMKVVVYDGKTEEVFKVEPKISNLRSSHIVGIMKNSKVLTSTVNLTISDLTTELRNKNGLAAIPLLETNEDGEKEYTVNKLALLKEYKLLTILDTKYIKSYKIINEELENGRKLITYHDIVVPYYITSAKRKIFLEEKNDKLNFRVKIEFEGDIEQFKFEEMLFDTKIINDVEQKIEEFTVKELNATTEYFKENIGEDYLGFKDYIYKYHNKIYNKYKDNWEEAFKNANIVYEVDASVRRVGTSKK